MSRYQALDLIARLQPDWQSWKLTLRRENILALHGADGGGRTHTASRPPDFESGASANSATSAYTNQVTIQPRLECPAPLAGDKCNATRGHGRRSTFDCNSIVPEKQLPEGPYRAQASNSQQSDRWSSRLDYQDECMEDVGFHEAMPHKGRENSRELCVISPLLGGVGMRASVSSNLIFGVGESASL